MKPKYELLKHAYEIIDGIPDDRFNLNHIFSWGQPDPNDCDTIACAMGWLSMHPDFNALGLTAAGGGLLYKGYAADFLGAAEEIFKISEDDAICIFDSAGQAGDWDYTKLPAIKSHKKIFQDRVKRFLKEHGQL